MSHDAVPIPPAFEIHVCPEKQRFLQSPLQVLARILFRRFKRYGVFVLKEAFANLCVAVYAAVAKKWPRTTLFFQNLPTAGSEEHVAIGIRTGCKQLSRRIADERSSPKL